MINKEEKVILMYEDESFYIKEYIEKLEKMGYKVKVLDNANDFLTYAKENYMNIDLYIIDIMVFGPGNEFDGRNTDGGARSGLVILDEIEKMEKEHPDTSPKKKIIFTNRKGPVFEEAKNDKRISKAIHKSDVLPSEFVEIIKEAI